MELANIYLFTGSEAYLINNRIKRIVNETKADEFNISIYDDEEVGIKEAIRDAATPPFMAEKKVIIIKNPLFLTNERNLDPFENESLLSYLNNPAPSTVLIINANNLRLDERKAVVKKLKKPLMFKRLSSFRKSKLSVGLKDNVISTISLLKMMRLKHFDAWLGLISKTQKMS